MEIIENERPPRPFTAKDAADIAAPKAFRPAQAMQITPAQAAGRIARVGRFIDWFLGLLGAGLIAGGFVYWSVADDNFQRSETLPFPFLAGAMALFGMWLFRRKLGAWPAKLAERARSCPPPGPVACSEDGLTFGGKTRAWGSLKLLCVGVIVRTTETGYDYFVNRLQILGADGPFWIDPHLMRDGQAVVDAAYLRLKPAP